MLVGPNGEFSGYASVFHEADQSGDVMMPGAFSKSLARRGASRIRLLFQHDPKEPVGTFESVLEDGHGLHVSGRLLPQIARARELDTLIAAGGLDGLSIGFRTIRATRDAKTRHRKIWQVDLWEISIVTFPMLESARIYPRPQDQVNNDRHPNPLPVPLAEKMTRAASLFRTNAKEMQ